MNTTAPTTIECHCPVCHRTIQLPVTPETEGIASHLATLVACDQCAQRHQMKQEEPPAPGRFIRQPYRDD